MRQEVVLAMLAKEPSYGYELRARLREALGPLGEAMNPGQVYVTLTRLEKTGLVTSRRAEGLADRPDRTVYGLTPAGQERVAEWLAEVSWPKPDLAEFHLKLVAAAAGLYWDRRISRPLPCAALTDRTGHSPRGLWIWPGSFQKSRLARLRRNIANWEPLRIC